VFRLGPFFLPLSLYLLTSTAHDLERAFLQNNASILARLFNPGAAIQVFLPEPISFSDILTAKQAQVFFERLLAAYPTLEFFIDTTFPFVPSRERWLIRARWSFTDKRQLRQHVVRIHFLVKLVNPNQRGKAGWKIIEMRAEKI